MEYDAQLAADALEWSKYLHSIGYLKHNTSFETGENLAWSSNQSFTTWATKAWYDEIEHFNWSKIGYQAGTGHFTQLIWAGSQKLGCGEYENYVTCRYYPAGNMYFKFEENVKPLK